MTFNIAGKTLQTVQIESCLSCRSLLFSNATTVAVRFCRERIATSPKKLPIPSSSTHSSLTSTCSRPESTMYMEVPVVPASMTMSPFSNVSGVIFAISSACARGGAPLNISMF